MCKIWHYFQVVWNSTKSSGWLWHRISYQLCMMCSGRWTMDLEHIVYTSVHVEGSLRNLMSLYCSRNEIPGFMLDWITASCNLALLKQLCGVCMEPPIVNMKVVLVMFYPQPLFFCMSLFVLIRYTCLSNSWVLFTYMYINFADEKYGISTS